MLMLLAFTCGACTSGALNREESESNVTTNVESGATNVDVHTAFTVTFSAPVSSPSVTASTFFVAPVTESPNAVVTAPSSKEAVDTAICNPAHALAGTIAASAEGACAQAFTLTPAAPLEEVTEYALCATAGISMCNPYRWRAA